MPPVSETTSGRAIAPQIKGWCPSARAPMATGDGLLIRVHTPGSVIDADQLRTIAEISADCGNGLVDLTQRSQLQLRGLTEATVEIARRRLSDHGLPSPEAGTGGAPKILVGAPRDLERRKGFGEFALAQELTLAIESDAALRALPPKFLFSIETADGRSLADVGADIRIELTDASHATICVAGGWGRGATVETHVVVGAALKLARAFVILRADRFELRRMRHLVAALGLDALLEAAKVEMQPFQSRAAGSVHSVLGAREAGGCVSVAVAAPFGRWRAEELARLANLATDFGSGKLFLTHWRTILFSTRTLVDAHQVIEAARELGLIVAPDDLRLAVVACSGAPECSQAQGETRAHLLRLAPLAQRISGADGVGVHISGCAKGCARAVPANVTLVARNGRFDFIEDGLASDTPRLFDLSIDDTVRALAARVETGKCTTR